MRKWERGLDGLMTAAVKSCEFSISVFILHAIFHALSSVFSNECECSHVNVFLTNECDRYTRAEQAHSQAESEFGRVKLF